MKFLRIFENSQNHKFSDHYARYQLLRTLIRTGSIGVATESQQADEERVAAFHDKVVNLLKLQANSLIESFDLPSKFSETAPSPSHVGVWQSCALEALIELRDDLQELQWFEYTNDQAHRLLRQKLQRKYPQYSCRTVSPKIGSIFKARVDRAQLFKWVELAIKFVEINLSPTVSEVSDSFLPPQCSASPPRNSLKRKAYIHELIKRTGRRTHKAVFATAPASEPRKMATVESATELDERLSQSLNHSDLFAVSAFQELDGCKRLPLHYAVYYGLLSTTQAILSRMQQAHPPTSQWDDLLSSLDHLGHSPLHIALLKGYTDIFDLLLARLVESNKLGQTHLQRTNLMVIAIKMDSRKTFDLLVQYGVGIDHFDTEGRGMLHYAAKSGQVEYLSALLNVMGTVEINKIDSNGLTPLIYASRYGLSRAAQQLLDNGANPWIEDLRGWTAQDYATHRGHMEFAFSLKDLCSRLQTPDDRSMLITDTRRECQHAIPDDAATQYSTNINDVPFISNEHTVIINMGSLDSSKPYLDLKLLDSSSNLGMGIEFLAYGDLQQPFMEIINLPILEYSTNLPYVISTRDLNSLQLVFRLLNVESLDGPNAQPKVLGTAFTLAQTLGYGLGQNRESLIREATVPIIDNQQRLLGTLTFSYLVISPFTFGGKPPAPQSLHRDSGNINMIGHRGNGMNALMKDRARVQLGENTIQSFLSAHSLGVSMVELDVQLTADLIPLVYHDYMVSETGTDAPVHVVTLDQFRHISQSQQGQRTRESMAEQRYESKIQTEKRQRARALSVDIYDDCRTTDITNRVKETYHYKVMGFKGNVRGDYVQEPINTLEELFKNLPTTLGFNMEIKYPMLWETEEWRMPNYSIEINTFTDRILHTCFTLGGSRRIILSSFSPEICIALSLKQRTYPVLFLSDAGMHPVGDARASTFQEGVHFAKRWGLDGVAMLAEPFILSRRLVEYVKGLGMWAMSHGGLNNDLGHVRTQIEGGVDALVVDDIVRVRRSLEQWQGVGAV